MAMLSFMPLTSAGGSVCSWLNSAAFLLCTVLTDIFGFVHYSVKKIYTLVRIRIKGQFNKIFGKDMKFNDDFFKIVFVNFNKNCMLT